MQKSLAKNSFRKRTNILSSRNREIIAKFFGGERKTRKFMEIYPRIKIDETIAIADSRKKEKRTRDSGLDRRKQTLVNETHQGRLKRFPAAGLAWENDSPLSLSNLYRDSDVDPRDQRLIYRIKRRTIALQVWVGSAECFRRRCERRAMRMRVVREFRAWRTRRIPLSGERNDNHVFAILVRERDFYALFPESYLYEKRVYFKFDKVVTDSRLTIISHITNLFPHMYKSPRCRDLCDIREI